MKKKKDIIEDRGNTDDEIKKEIGKNIKQMRSVLGLSALTVSNHLGISREAVTHMENGRNNISAVSLWKLAILFNCEIQDFFPNIPDGYAITKIDLHKIEQENGKKAAIWAERLFKNNK